MLELKNNEHLYYKVDISKAATVNMYFECFARPNVLRWNSLLIMYIWYAAVAFLKGFFETYLYKEH